MVLLMLMFTVVMVMMTVTFVVMGANMAMVGHTSIEVMSIGLFCQLKVTL